MKIVCSKCGKVKAEYYDASSELVFEDCEGNCLFLNNIWDSKNKSW